MNPRDQQRRVYESEEAALAHAGRAFRHLGEVRAYVADLVASDWWAERWPDVDAIPVRRSRSGRMSGYAVDGAREIRLASLREPVVLHEIAHVVTPGAGHGPAFVNALLALVRERLGFHSYGALLAEFRRRHVVGR
ncbi:MAG: hypothetical protein AB1679_26995 [Actinomycetota bacterium]